MQEKVRLVFNNPLSSRSIPDRHLPLELSEEDQGTLLRRNLRPRLILSHRANEAGDNKSPPIITAGHRYYGQADTGVSMALLLRCREIGLLSGQYTYPQGAKGIKESNGKEEYRWV